MLNVHKTFFRFLLVSNLVHNLEGDLLIFGCWHVLDQIHVTDLWVLGRHVGYVDGC